MFDNRGYYTKSGMARAQYVEYFRRMRRGAPTGLPGKEAFQIVAFQNAFNSLINREIEFNGWLNQQRRAHYMLKRSRYFVRSGRWPF